MYVQEEANKRRSISQDSRHVTEITADAGTAGEW